MVEPSSYSLCCGTSATLAPVQRSTHSPVEQPTLWLGSAGFNSDERSRLTSEAALFSGPVRWGFCAFPDADAWIVNGSRVQAGDGNTVRVAPGLPTERAIKLSLNQVNRPLAFATPLPPQLEPLCSFDLMQARTVQESFARLAAWLKPRRVQFALGRQIVRHGATLRHGVFHLFMRGRLLAVLNFRTGKAAYVADLAPETLDHADWLKRPPTAGDAPPRFVQTTIAQLSWTYVRHSERDLLPPRYRDAAIYFRGAPKVPLHWLSDTQLLLMRELNTEAGSVHDLRQRTGLGEAQLEKDLTCLYFASAITTTPSKAARPARSENPEDRPSSSPAVADLMLATESPPAESHSTAPLGLSRQFATVPTPLMA